ncbi:MAG: hypothetical protein WEB88_17585 [Gemmatimonadota bacterium]
MLRLLLPLAVVFILAGGTLLGGCGTADPGDERGITVDTLANGALHVRNDASGVWTPEERWRLVEDLRIGSADGQGPDVFGRVGSALLDTMGRLWVMDPTIPEMRVFDIDGTYVRTVGRRGSGPGELSNGGNVFRGPDGEIWAEDTRERRWERFDTAGNVVGRTGINSNLGNGARRWTPDGRLLEIQLLREPGAAPGEERAIWVRNTLDAEGQLVPGDSFPFPVLPTPERVRITGLDGRGSISFYIPFAANGMRALSQDGSFWVAEPGPDYRIRHVSLTGDTLLVFERSYEPVAVPDSARQPAIDNMYREGFSQPDLDPDEIPTAHPPFARLYEATDGMLWVLRVAEHGRSAFDVFTAAGHYLGQVAGDVDLEALRVFHISDEHVFAMAADELGVQSIVRVRIEKPGP